MSNKTVPTIYKQVIASTLTSSRPDFEEQGVEDAVMVQLQRLWEQKLAASGVADFSQDPRAAEVARAQAVAKTQAGAGDSKPDIKSKGKMPSSDDAEPSKSKMDDDDELGSDLDDSDEEVDKEGGDLVIALYEKVSRVRNKWKVQLKDGVVNVKGKEYLFNKCQGEFEW